MKNHIKADLLLVSDKEISQIELDNFVDRVIDLAEELGLDCAGSFERLTEEEVLNGHCI